MCDIFFSLTKSTELWAAIIGAIVGGLIAFITQMIALREGRTQREEDYNRLRQALGHSLLFKVIRIFSNTSNIKDHFHESDLRAAGNSNFGENWQIYRALANPPEPISFSSDEMGMLLSLKNDEIFNSMIDTDVRHNSLITALRRFNQLREELTQSIITMGRLHSEDGVHLTHALSDETVNILRPKMLEVNDLANQVKAAAEDGFGSGKENLFGLHELLKDSLGIKFDLQIVKKQSDSPPPSSSNA